MILRDVKKLDISYIPQKILCRDNEIRNLRMYMKSGRAIISGGVGTGKTLLAKHFGGSEHIDAYINCYINRTEHRVVEEIVHQIKPNFHTAGLTTLALWKEIEEGKMIILDEIDGMMADELKHFSYTLSRLKENGKEIRYIAITRSANILRQIINDDAIWSTFADKAIVSLDYYTWDEIKKIVDYRAGEAIRRDAYNDDILSLIADITLKSPGHMRTAIDILRNAAMIAESKGDDKIMPEHVREANQEGWLSDIDTLKKNDAVVLLSIANACKNKAYAEKKEIEEQIKIKSEEYGIKIDDLDKIIEQLINEDFIYKGNKGYTILNYPCNEIIKKMERHQ